MHYAGSTAITGTKPWKGPEKIDVGRGGVIDNIKAFVGSINSGRPLNNAAETVRSNLTAILGRMAAYRNTVVTWDEMMRSNERLNLNLPKMG
jgi:hypothetical protein